MDYSEEAVPTKARESTRVVVSVGLNHFDMLIWDPIFLRLRSRRVLVLGGNLRTSPLRRLAMQCLQVRAALVCLRTPVRGRKCRAETGVSSTRSDGRTRSQSQSHGSEGKLILLTG